MRRYAKVTPLPPKARRAQAAATIQKAFRSSAMTRRRSTQTMSVFRNSRLSSIFPDRILTKVQAIATFYVPAAVAAGQYYFTILSNSYYQPFNSGTPYSGANNGSAVNSIGGATTDGPAGYNDAVTYYTYYKVHKYKVEVEVMPTNNNDPINLTIADYCTGGPSNISTYSQQEISESAWAKTRLCQVGMGPNKLTNFVDCRKLLGYSDVQYKGLGPAFMLGAPNSNQGCTTGIRWETANNTALSGTLAFQVKLTQWIDLGVPDVLTAV